jgi:drug/metabolite transporter (DMT)-like permease
MTSRREAKPHFALLVVQIAFASQAVESKVAMMPRALGGEGIPPDTLALFRVVGAALAFQIVRWTRPRSEPIPRARDHVTLVALSVLGVVVNQTLFLRGLSLTTPFSAALLTAAIPLLTTVLSVASGREPLHRALILGMPIAAAGVLCLTGFGTIDRGVVYVLCNSLAYSAYLVFGKRTVERFGALTVVAWIFTYGAVMLTPWSLRATWSAVPSLTPRGVWFIAYVVLVPTIIAYLLNAWALARTTSSTVTVYIFMQPVLAALLAWVQLGQPITSRTALAFLLVSSGVSIVVFGKR